MNEVFFLALSGWDDNTIESFFRVVNIRLVELHFDIPWKISIHKEWMLSTLLLTDYIENMQICLIRIKHVALIFKVDELSMESFIIILVEPQPNDVQSHIPQHQQLYNNREHTSWQSLVWFNLLIEI